MEFVPGRRDGFYCEEDDQQESSSKHPPFVASSPSSSSSTLRWEPSTDAPSGTAEPMAPPIEREHMFDKVVTPSDVGKLNRLVIPKQHAEKYFPLDASTNEKGLLLNFEDWTGKPWRFRYSYWNSSQSYVMTKGWSRFVKEKRLDAGDTVSFGRGVGESGKDRLFIDWKRRPEPHDPHRFGHLPLPLPLPANYSMVPFARSVGPWAGSLLVPPSAYDHHRQSYGYNVTSPGSSSGQYLVFRPAVVPPHVRVQHGNNGGDGTVSVPMVLESAPVVHSQAAAKRVRLFGVNLDFPESDGDPADCSLRSQRVLQLQLGGVESSEAFSSSSSSPSPSPRLKEKQSSLDLDM